MSPTTDLVSTLITAAMMALLRVIDAWIAIDQGLPTSALAPRPIADLDAEARRYVDLILADRRATT